MERRIDRGIRGLSAGVLLLVGCESSNTQPAVSTETPLPVVTQTIEFISPEIKAIFDEVYAKHGVRLSTQREIDNPKIYQETKIIALTLDKISAAGYLINGGIIIHKDRVFYGSGRLGGIPFYDENRGGFNLIIGYDFEPNSREGTYDLVGRETHKELLQWIIVHDAGHLFNNRVQFDPTSFSINHPVHITFAKIAGFEVKIRNFRFSETESQDFPVWSKVSPARFFVRPEHTGSIEETFADYFAASILTPEVMTEQERRYFGVINDGLRNNPQLFIQEVREDPRVLLK